LYQWFLLSIQSDEQYRGASNYFEFRNILPDL
jgi:hypothetical protein